MRGFLRILAVVLCGAALALSFAPFDHSWLVWGWMWVLLPILWTTSVKKRAFRGFGLGWLGGITFWVINLKWLGSVTWPGALALSAYLALYFGVFGAFSATVGNPWLRKYTEAEGIRGRFREMFRSLGYATILAGFWCGLEWVRGILFTGFAWNGLGVTFAKNLVMAQSAEYIGVIGLAFFPVFMSVVAVQTARRFYEQFKVRAVKMLHWDFAVALLVIMAGFTLGTARLVSVTNAAKIEAQVLLVQQNIPQKAGVVDPAWVPQRIVDGFIELTEKGLEEAQRRAGEALRTSRSEEEIVELKMPDLLVWPEACLPDFLELRDDGSSQGGPAIESIFNYVLSLGEFTFVTGINEFSGDGPMDPKTKVYNSLVAQSARRERETYQKHHLVILGEYIPDLPFLRELYYDAAGVEFGSGLSSGESFEPLSFMVDEQEVGLIPSICFEDTVQRVTRRFIREEPQVLVNLTNDGWFGESEGAAQHFRNALFRTIELRRPMVRAANRGVTGVVTTAGSLTDPYTGKKRSLLDENGSHFHRGYILAPVYIPAKGEVTLYAVLGDWFAVTGLVLSLIYAAFSLIQKSRTGVGLKS